MRVNIISYEPIGGWILADYAEKLRAALQEHVDAAVLSASQEPGYDVTFHINYFGLRQLQVPGLHSTMVTHIDTPEKFSLVQAHANAGVWGFCCSEDTTRRMSQLTGSSRFCSMPPVAMSEVEPMRINVMIAGRLYEDGRKNEKWAIDFFQRISPEHLVIRVIGGGWDEHLAQLATQGYRIEYQQNFNKATYLQYLKASDYLLVTGFDEGALSTLDAILYGVTPIVTAQGYHLEQRAGIRLFSTFNELMVIAESIQTDATRINRDRELLADWSTFAVKHRDRWQAIINSGGQ